MPDLARFAHRFRFLRLLRASLALGALYDAVFAGLMVAAPGRLGEWFEVPLPPRFFLWLLAVVLLMLAGFYLLAAKDPRRYSGNIAVAIVGRLAGAVALGLAAGLHDLAGLWGAAAADAGFALAHFVLWRPLR
jgi:hypothetical protein